MGLQPRLRLGMISVGDGTFETTVSPEDSEALLTAKEQHQVSKALGTRKKPIGQRPRLTKTVDKDIRKPQNRQGPSNIQY